MKTFLQMLFNGSIKPTDDVIPERMEYTIQQRQMDAAMEKLYKRLNEEDRKLFEKYEYERDQLEALYGEDCFSHGFRLASILFTEVFGDSCANRFNEGAPY